MPTDRETRERALVEELRAIGYSSDNARRVIQQCREGRAPQFLLDLYERIVGDQ